MPNEDPPQLEPIRIADLDELMREEPRIVERINSVSGGGILFLTDPLRALQDMNVVLTPEARRALGAALSPDGNPVSPVRQLYDDFKRNGPDENVGIVFRGILPKRE